MPHQRGGLLALRRIHTSAGCFSLVNLETTQPPQCDYGKAVAYALAHTPFPLPPRSFFLLKSLYALILSFTRLIQVFPPYTPSTRASYLHYLPSANRVQ